MYECDFAEERVKRGGKDGYCLYKHCYCDGNGFIPFKVECEKVNKKDVCKKGSIFGNYNIALTDEQIEGLKNGEIFVLVHEQYNIFIGRMEQEA